ncbi:MAG TPA: 50S ribosomal protein L10 [Candidatus Dormibacteraeota bacterium]|nr:50S ribosomal protein L10 [Candidatus Dormibacteraeota bacterium]
MPTEAKRAAVAELTEAFSGSSTSIVADYRGLSVSEINAVRRALRQQGIGYHVVKNRLARLAAEQAGVPEMGPLLAGPSSVALGEGDEAKLARDFLDATRPFKAVVVRGAVVRGRRLAADDVARLAALPPREVLLAQLAGAMSAPLGSLAGLFAAPLRNLGSGLAQLAERGGAGGS